MGQPKGHPWLTAAARSYSPCGVLSSEVVCVDGRLKLMVIASRGIKLIKRDIGGLFYRRIID